MAIKRFLADIITIFFDSELSQMADEIKRLHQKQKDTLAKLHRLRSLADQRTYRDRISRLQQTILQLEDANRKLEQEVSALKITTNKKAKKTTSRGTASRHKKNTGGWRREDIDALRQFQDLPLAELSVMFIEHSANEIQDMLSRIRNEEA